MASPLGTILNKSTELKRVTAVIKPGNTVVTGLVYVDVANGVKNAPTNGSKKGADLYWFDKPTIIVAAGAADKKVTIYALDGLQVIGTADLVIPVNGRIKASTNHVGELQSHPIPTVADEGDTSTVDLGGQLAAADQATYTYFEDVVGIYRGHEDEVKEGKTITASVDRDTDCVFDLRGGN